MEASFIANKLMARRINWDKIDLSICQRNCDGGGGHICPLLPHHQHIEMINNSINLSWRQWGPYTTGPSNLFKRELHHASTAGKQVGCLRGPKAGRAHSQRAVSHSVNKNDTNRTLAVFWYEDGWRSFRKRQSPQCKNKTKESNNCAKQFKYLKTHWIFNVNKSGTFWGEMQRIDLVEMM